jgi:hypothetical protein
MRALKVLVIGNFSVSPCGIRNFADMTLGGLRRSPDVLCADPWDATYDLIYARREAGYPTYLPPDYLRYDVIHLNWHPIALNTYNPEHFPWAKGEGPLLSVYLNDVPPWSGCPVAERAEVLVAPEEYNDASRLDARRWGPDHLMVYPIPDWVEDLPSPNPEFTVGWSGVRGDGAAELRGVCEAHGWKMNMTEPPAERTLPWVSVEEEIRRLARSTVNVCWYRQGRGIAGTPSMMLGSRRPLLLNDSPMFRPWQTGHYEWEVYNNYAGPQPAASDIRLEDALLEVHNDWRRKKLIKPGPRVYTDHSWTTAARDLTTAWRSALEAR